MQKYPLKFINSHLNVATVREVPGDQAWKKYVSALAECHFANRHFCKVAGTFGLTGGLKRKKGRKKGEKRKTKKA